jgi:hypothetical protein
MGNPIQDKDIAMPIVSFNTQDSKIRVLSEGVSHCLAKTEDTLRKTLKTIADFKEEYGDDEETDGSAPIYPSEVYAILSNLKATRDDCLRSQYELVQMKLALQRLLAKQLRTAVKGNKTGIFSRPKAEKQVSNIVFLNKQNRFALVR